MIAGMSQRTVAALLFLVILAMGGFMLKLEVFDTIAAARAHEKVSFSEKGVLLAPLFLVVGVVGLGVAAFAKTTPPKPRAPGPYKMTALQWAVALLVVALFAGLGIGLRMWLVSQLAALGYTV